MTRPFPKLHPWNREVHQILLREAKTGFSTRTRRGRLTSRTDSTTQTTDVMCQTEKNVVCYFKFNNTVGAQTPKAFEIWMVESYLDFELLANMAASLFRFWMVWTIIVCCRGVVQLGGLVLGLAWYIFSGSYLLWTTCTTWTFLPQSADFFTYLICRRASLQNSEKICWHKTTFGVDKIVVLTLGIITEYCIRCCLQHWEDVLERRDQARLDKSWSEVEPDPTKKWSELENDLLTTEVKILILQTGLVFV